MEEFFRILKGGEGMLTDGYYLSLCSNIDSHHSMMKYVIGDHQNMTLWKKQFLCKSQLFYTSMILE